MRYVIFAYSQGDGSEPNGGLGDIRYTTGLLLGLDEHYLSRAIGYYDYYEALDVTNGNMFELHGNIWKKTGNLRDIPKLEAE